MKTLNYFLLLCSLCLVFCAFADNNNKSAIDFLNALNKEQLEKTSLPFDDTSRVSWHFLPSSMYPREGITLGELNATQKDLFAKMFREFISESGYKKTKQIINLENILVELGGDPDFRDATKYFIAFYGNPKKDDIWAWSFEGHHVSLNFTISKNKIVASPRFYGANPAIVTKGKNKGLHTLHKEETLAYGLLHSMTEIQKKQAIFRTVAFKDIVTSHDSEVSPLDKKGISVKSLDASQKELLKAIIMEYLKSLPKQQAEQRAQQITKEELNDITFGWAGNTALGEAHYYRIQGTSFLIELDNTQNNANHIHCVWRDFNGDFGRDLIKEHYKNAAHH